MRTIYCIDPELGHVKSEFDADLLDIYGEIELGYSEPLVIVGDLLSELYLSESLLDRGKSAVRIRKEVISGKVRFILRLPPETSGIIYLVHALRAYKYVLVRDKTNYNYGY